MARHWALKRPTEIKCYISMNKLRRFLSEKKKYCKFR